MPSKNEDRGLQITDWRTRNKTDYHRGHGGAQRTQRKTPSEFSLCSLWPFSVALFSVAFLCGSVVDSGKGLQLAESGIRIQHKGARTRMGMKSATGGKE
jgi:hypothetical protein